MKARMNSFRLFLLFSLFACARLNAAVESVTASLAGDLGADIVDNAHISLAEPWYPFPSGWNAIFRVNEARANVVLRYDDSRQRYTNTAWQLDVEYSITTRDAAGAPTTVTGQTLTITYDPREGITYLDRDMRQYANAHQAAVTVTDVLYSEWATAGSGSPTVSSTIPAALDDIYLDVELHTERFYYQDPTNVPNATYTINSTTNEMTIAWTYVQGAESYDVEWLFIDTGDDTYPYTATSYPYDWRNATRVNVPTQHYTLSLAYPKGILLFRIRGVGIDWDNYVNNSLITRGDGTWTSTTTAGNTGSYSSYRYNIQYGLAPTMNWAYSAGFAEDGKRMEGAAFYDGMMRGRESVAVVNSDGNVVVGSNAYDFEGRPVVSILPYPATSEGIKYYGGNAGYDREDFDRDANVAAPAAMGTTGGSGKYYSSSTSATGMDLNTANADGYPYARVTYTNDGTNRPASSTGVGEDLNAGSGRETQYFYGTPSQHQLDRLFGNEVGYAMHYKKNFTIDPNGVVSVAYIDMHGRVVATALAGLTPDNLEAIDNPNGNPDDAVAMTDNLLTTNQLIPSGNGMEAQNTLTVTETSLHSFSYTIGQTPYTGTGCYTTGEAGVYDLTIRVTDTRTGALVTPITGSNPTTATAISSGTYTFSMTLPPGTYKVEKTLTLNQANLLDVRQDFIDYQVANEGIGDCLDSIFITPVPCAGNCHEACLNHYYIPNPSGAGYVYVDDDGVVLSNQGSGSGDPGPMLIAACELNLCDKPTLPDPCEVKRAGMLEDMSPGGQYFDNLPSRFSINTTSGLQTINANYFTVGSTSGDINNWLEAQPNASAMLAAINADWAGTDFTTWDQVRDNWDNNWAEILLVYHPEYCAWNYHCNWSCIYTYTDPTPPGNPITDTLYPSDAFDYEMATMFDTDGNFSGSDGYYWNPLNMTANTSDTGATTANTNYMPYGGSNVLHQDPRFAGDCDIMICDTTTDIYAETTLQNHLKNFYPAYDNTNAFIGYYSLWYVAVDPNNIHLGNSGLSTATVDFFVALHGDGTIEGLIDDDATAGPGQIMPYQFFRSVYWHYRTLVIEQGFVGDATVADCQDDHGTAVPLYDADGYLDGDADNPTLTPEGYTIYFLHNPLIDLYGDGCDDPTAAELETLIDGLVDAGAANPDSIDIVVPADATCSCTMLDDFITSRGLTSSTNAQIATALNDELDPATDYTATQVGNWLTECAETEPDAADLVTQGFPVGLTCDLDIGIEDADAAVQTNCENENADLANYTAYNMYQQQLQAAADAYLAAYVSWCTTHATETFNVGYNLHEYYYTLYYYDQAGNLVKTVPPEGVNLINLGADNMASAALDSVDIRLYRNDFYANGNAATLTYCPAVHDMRSQYAYNSQQQPTVAKQNEQGTAGSDDWESGQTTFWYDFLGRMVASQNSLQAAMSPPAYSYTIYDELGRISEVGQLQTSTALTNVLSRDNDNEYYYYEFVHTVSNDDFLDWINDAATTKREVTTNFYDVAMSGVTSDVTNAFGTAGQENLRNRVSAVVYDDDPTTTSNLYTATPPVGQPSYLSAFHYSYDVHGNVKTVVQETPPLKTHNQNVKTTSYEYDLISGNVNEVHYQDGQRDEFHHKYEYDANARLHMSYSSRDGQTWEKESKQFYYATGGLGRMEIGDKTVQGLDYVYTINGWMKGLNRNTIGDNGSYMSRDIGQDAVSSTSNINKYVGADAAGFTLQYWQAATGINDDYAAIGASSPFQADMNPSAYGSAIANQYNGNIAGMVTSLLDNTQTGMEVQGRAFSYDQLYRIKQSMAFHMDGAALSGNAWQSSYTQNNRYREDFSYDWNGNIKTVDRYAGNLVAGTAVKSDDLTYNYATNSNWLTSIDDGGAAACSYSDDLDDQAANNYVYDAVGAMTDDVIERITDIEWTPFGKMKAVRKDQANNTDACTSTEYADADVEYLYTASQQRLCKIVKPHKAAGAGISDQDDWTYFWYVYDAGGMVMAVYKQTFEEDNNPGNTHKVHFDLEEHDVYGSGRLGIRDGDEESKYYQSFNGTITGGTFSVISYTGNSAAYSKTHYVRELGKKQYEIANHLGNVLVTINDKRLTYSATPSTATTVDWYTADVMSYSDYYAFGAPQTGRAGGDSYRYGFNGKENDDEVKGVSGSHQDYGLRMYDPRVGRFFSSDPLRFDYPHYTPYQFAGNKPIRYIDLDGGEELDYKKLQGKPTGNEVDPSGQKLDLKGAYHVQTYTGSTATFDGSTNNVITGSVANYYDENGVWHSATFNNKGEFIGYSRTEGSYDTPELASIDIGPEALYYGIPVPGQQIEYVTTDHVPSQYELLGGDGPRGINGQEIALAAGAQYMEEGLLVVTGGAMVLGAFGGFALASAPVWVPIVAEEASMFVSAMPSTVSSMTGAATVGMLPRFISAGADLTGQLATNEWDLNRVNTSSVTAQFFLPNPLTSSAFGSALENKPGSNVDNTIFGNKSFSTFLKETAWGFTGNCLSGSFSKFESHPVPNFTINHNINMATNELSK